MSATPPLPTKRQTVQSIRGMKNLPQAFVALTAYTAPIAQLVDEVADVVLVGDSVGMVIYGMPNTISVTLDMMIAHGRCVAQHSTKALCVVDMPFGSYQASHAQAFENCARVLQETGAAAVKIEGGAEMADTIAFLVERGIPVMGHVGLRPQQVLAMGGYRVQGKNDDSLQQLMTDGLAIEKAGAFSVVVEGTVAGAAEQLTKKLSIPTIGIGASAACDGQILVTDDLLGITPGKKAKFVKMYANVNEVAQKALAEFAADVKARRFPGPDQLYGN